MQTLRFDQGLDYRLLLSINNPGFSSCAVYHLGILMLEIRSYIPSMEVFTMGNRFQNISEISNTMVHMYLLDLRSGLLLLKT